ncbi:hypothetical protein [uncultured Flavobacterium sp.]|uniref:hypothetical protein n=1 Tax=uncultured Flavobacterium sp. TaxID=165435 RepID=UPI0030C821F4
MKKKLEGELISIAHRVLKLKNRSETVLLQQEAKKLYEQLTVLRFYEENFENLKNDISPEQLEEKLEQMATIAAVETTDLEEKVAEVAQPVEETKPVEEEVEQPTEVQAEEVIAEEPVKEDVVAEEIVTETVEPAKEEVYASAEDINKIVAEMANKKNVLEETPIETVTFEASKPNEPQQISFEDLLGESYKEPEFVRVEDTPKEVEKAADLVFEKKEEVVEPKKEEVEAAADVIFERANELPQEEKKEEYSFTTLNAEKTEAKPKSLNDRLNSGISFGLNDRIAFEKKLFGGSADDFNRVISQLNTFDSFDEAKSFISDFVKPDYKNWEGQEEFETRFLEIIEKKFN